jgi:N utilization substance protein A
LGEGVVEKLTEAGITSVEALADMTPEQLEAIPGIGPKTVEKISIAVNNYFASLEGVEAAAEGAQTSETAEEAAPSDLDIAAQEGETVEGQPSEEPGESAAAADGSSESEPESAASEQDESTPANDTSGVSALSETPEENSGPENRDRE